MTDSASSTQHMPDPYELAQERRRRREADEATADVLVGPQGERVPITAWVDSYYWSCRVCGWLGKGYTSIEGAMCNTCTICGRTHHGQGERCITCVTENRSAAA